MFILPSQKKTEREKFLQVSGNLKSKEENISSFGGKRVCLSKCLTHQAHIWSHFSKNNIRGNQN